MLDMIVCMLGALSISMLPVFLTINVEQTNVYQDPMYDVAPMGYFWSNVIWIITSILLTIELIKIKHLLNVNAIVLTLVIITGNCFLLDLFFASRFFVFPNKAAIIGWHINGYNWETGNFTFPIPLEEFIFYISGLYFILVFYLFNRHSWLVKYTISPSTITSMSNVSRNCNIFTSIIVIFGIILKFLCINDIFPEYFLWILSCSFVPSTWLYGKIKHLVNWQAFSFTLSIVLLVSIIWEVTLALPYGFWNYRHTSMIGIFIKPWNNLPIESVFIWIITPFTVVFLYEYLLFSINPSLNSNKKF